MKKFMEPEVKVEIFAVEDVVTTSSQACSDETPLF